ncbi:hypothetical protein M8C21_031434, partial [Ambrosia artemisiifolia]
MTNVTYPSPNPALYTSSISPNITLFKCTENVTYFEPHSYNSYTGCKDHNFYYNYLNGTVPSNLPHTCHVVHLPMKVPGPGVNETNIFSLLTSSSFLNFNLSHSCSDCLKNWRLCNTENGQDVQCLDVKWENAGTKKSKHRAIKILVGSLLILILPFVIFIIWRRCKSRPFSYVSSKNKSQNDEDISLSSGVSVFSYKELEDATKSFDPSRELGDGGYGAVFYGKLKDGREVAVKKLHEHNYNRVQQFRNEIEILTKLRHPNLVVLY